MEAIQFDPTDASVVVMLLPLQTDNLLLPDVMVAEVRDAGDIDIPANSPEWFIGSIQWRGQELPLISFESLNGAMARSADSVERIAIINSMADHGHLPTYAVALNGEPVILDVDDQAVTTNEGRPRGRAEAMSVSINSVPFGTATAGIPNVEWVEQHLLAYTLHG